MARLLVTPGAEDVRAHSRYAAACRSPLGSNMNTTAAVTKRAKRVLTRRPVFGWAMYDWANSSFACTVMAGFFPLFFKNFWNAGVPATESTFRLGLANGIASLIVALLVLLVGVIADKGRARVRLLGLFTVLGAAMTAGMFNDTKKDRFTAS